MDTKVIEFPGQPLQIAEFKDGVSVRRRKGRNGIAAITAEIAPPQLICPACDVTLVYQQTVTGGVKPVERWHYFQCRTCGPFVYRDRTRKLRPTT